MATDAKGVLAGYLKELHLPACRKSYEELARQAQQESLSCEQYLPGLAERECQERRAKRINRLLRQARLPLGKRWPAVELERFPAEVLQRAKAVLGGSLGARC